MGSDDAPRSVAMVVAAVVVCPVLVVVLLVVVLAGGAQSAPCGTSGTALGVGPLSGNGIPVELVPLIQQAGTVCPEFPAPVIAAQLQQESDFNPRAVSPSGAQGIAQFMPDTWPGYGVGDPFDPAAAIPAQARFDCELAAAVTAADVSGRLHLTVSVTEAALFGYNAGLVAVYASGTGVPTNAQSADYVPLIMGKARTTFSTTTAAPSAAASSAPASGPPTTAPAGTTATAVVAPAPGCSPGGVVGPGGGPAAQAVAAAALTQVGLPYVWGGGGYAGSTGGGFDCSGLSSYAYHQVGLDLPRTAQQQYLATAAQQIPGGFDPAAYQPGDLLFWGTAGNVHHVAVAIGGGQLVEAPDFGQLVSTRPIYKADFLAAARPSTPATNQGAPQ